MLARIRTDDGVEDLEYCMSNRLTVGGVNNQGGISEHIEFTN